MATELGTGVSYLRRGFGMWRHRPGLMVLGMVPALIVFVLLTAAFVVLCLEVDDVVRGVTGFADGWVAALRVLFRVLLGIAVLVAALLLASALFVALTLVVGDPFYERIWRETELMLGGPQPGDGPGIWTAVRDGLVLAAVGLAITVGLFVLGFLPVVGTVLGAVLGVLAAGRLLAVELLGRPLEARGFDRVQRKQLMAPRHSAVLGFGTAAQLFFLVPLGAVVVMPAAVVGATMLARDLLPASPPPAKTL